MIISIFQQSDSTTVDVMQPTFYSGVQNAFPFFDLVSQAYTIAGLEEELFSQLYCGQLLLTEQLMQNQTKLAEALERQRLTSESGTSSQPNSKKRSSEEEDYSRSPFSKSRSSSELELLEQKNTTPKALSRLRIKKRFKYDFDVEQEEGREVKKCETKNIIKNFVKSIFSFIRKRRTLCQKTLNHLGVDSEIFLQTLNSLNDKVNTIQELRSLWNEHEYKNIFRVFSSHFLRKYYPKHIFNSRIINYSVHLKYRMKLLESLCAPEDFTSLKDF